MPLKLALSLHPDKNGAPGADEAFKCMFQCTLLRLNHLIVSDSGFEGLPGTVWCVSLYQTAASRLTLWIIDPQKRAAYDQHGSDPESRFGAGPSFARAAPGFRGGGPYEGELSPEDLFNMFFGGGMGPGFGNGPSTLLSLMHAEPY